MNDRDLLTMYHREITVVMELNGIETPGEALDIIKHEMYASLGLFGKKSSYKLPEDFSIEDFRRQFNKTLQHL